MNTREPTPPGEAQVLTHGPADVTAPTSPNIPTPGVSAGVTRIPTAPTLPDPDPVNLTFAISRIANELFGVPATADVPTSGASLDSSPSAAPIGGAGGGIAPTLDAGPLSAAPVPPSTEVPSVRSMEGANPFFVAPQFDGLFSGNAMPTLDADVLRFPLVDAGPAAAVPAPSAPLTASTAAPAPSAPGASDYVPAGTAPGTHVPSALPVQSEIDPIVRLELPKASEGFDANALRNEFPILQERVHGKRLVWLDNAATTQKPSVVIERVKYFYEHENSNIHRAAHALAARATDAYEGARESVRRFLNAQSKDEIIFVRGATEGINLVAQSWGRRNVTSGDEILITWLEHHANIVPWQQLCAATGARLRVAPVDDTGQIILEEYEKLLGPKTRIVSFPMVSNALGTVTPAKPMVDIAHRYGARVLVDAAQSVSHMRVDAQALDCDFLVFSGHKIFAPTGIGAVFGKSDVLKDMPPWQGGGNMIQDVTFERTTYQPPPARFEAGTGNIADAVGLGTALDWLSRVGIENVSRHEHDLLVYATKQLSTVPGLRIIGTAVEKAGVISFVVAGHSTQEVSEFLDREGIAVRGGHHCAQPILRRFGLESTVRASFAPYNVMEDVDALVDALCKLQAVR